MVTLRGLEPTQDYTVTLRVAPADTCRYKFLNMQWSAVGESEINQNEARQLFVHPNSPNTGEFWMKKPISFKSVKITHNPTSRNGNVSPVRHIYILSLWIWFFQILLHTMHKYVLEIIVGPADGAATTATTMKLDDTAFIAVSAYQNTNLTQLKIDNNPFAKGFRDKFRGTVFHSEMSTYTSGFPSLPFPIMGQQVQSKNPYCLCYYSHGLSLLQVFPCHKHKDKCLPLPHPPSPILSAYPWSQPFLLLKVPSLPTLLQSTLLTTSLHPPQVMNCCD